MTVLVSLGFAIIVLLALIVWELWEPVRYTATDSVQVPNSAPLPSQADGQVEILYGSPGAWRHHSWRPGDHADVQEALDTPGLAIRYNGTLAEGKQ